MTHSKAQKNWRVATPEEELEAVQLLHQSTVKLLKKVASSLRDTVDEIYAALDELD